jgi:hypothetical protein
VDDGVPGVGAAVITHDEVVSLGEQIDDLPLGGRGLNVLCPGCLRKL